MNLDVFIHEISFKLHISGISRWNCMQINKKIFCCQINASFIQCTVYTVHTFQRLVLPVRIFFCWLFDNFSSYFVTFNSLIGCSLWIFFLIQIFFYSWNKVYKWIGMNTKICINNCDWTCVSLKKASWFQFSGIKWIWESLTLNVKRMSNISLTFLSCMPVYDRLKYTNNNTVSRQMLSSIVLYHYKQIKCDSIASQSDSSKITENSIPILISKT